MRFQLFEEFDDSNLKSAIATSANRFLKDLSQEYDLRKDKTFDKNIGNCAWFTETYSTWAKKNRIDHEIIYFPETAKAPDAHIAPIVNGYVIDFAYKQFTGGREMYKISKPEEYRKFGYEKWETYKEVPPLETVFPLEKLDENVIYDKLKLWFNKAKGLAEEVWEATKRESRETKEAVRLLDMMVRGEEVTDQQKKFLQAQAIDLAKALPLIAIQGIPVPVPITPFLLVLGKKAGFNILPDSHLKSDYKF